jgi:hypothetical protein
VEGFNVNLGAPLIAGTLLGLRSQTTVNLYTGFGAWQVANFSGSDRSFQTVTGANYLSLTFRRRNPPLDLTYTPVTASSLLGPWTNNTVQVGSAINNGDGTETVTFRDSIPAAPPASQRYLRVNVSRTP